MMFHPKEVAQGMTAEGRGRSSVILRDRPSSNQAVRALMPLIAWVATTVAWPNTGVAKSTDNPEVGSDLPGYRVVQRIPLGMRVVALTWINCRSRCGSPQTDEHFPTSDGQLELEEDARLSATSRELYWGDGCRPMPTYRNAMVALRTSAGVIVATLALDSPLGQIDEPIRVRPGLRTFVIANRHRACDSNDGVAKELLDIDPLKHAISFERTEGPDVITLRAPGMGAVGVAVNRGLLTFNDRGRFELDATPASASAHEVSCFRVPAVESGGGEFTWVTGTVDISYKLNGSVWKMDAHARLADCNIP